MKADRLIVPRWLFNQWRYQVTPAGKVVLGSILLAALGTVTVRIPIYLIFFSLLSFYYVCWIAGWFFRPKVTVSGQFPKTGQVGRPLEATFSITNVGKRSIYELMVIIIDLPRGLVMANKDRVVPHLRPGETIDFPVVLDPQQRGEFGIPPLRPHTTFPFNLVRHGSVKHECGRVIILPRYEPIENMRLPIGWRYAITGAIPSGRSGESMEFLGNREYVPGEPMRRLDVKAWARRGTPVVREFHEETAGRVGLILDPVAPAVSFGGLFQKNSQGKWRPTIEWGTDGFLYLGESPDGFGHPRFEAAVSLLAGIVDCVADEKRLLDWIAVGNVLLNSEGGSSQIRRWEFLEGLALVEAEETKKRIDPVEYFSETSAVIAHGMGVVSSIVCVLLDWDEPRQQLVESIVAQGCPVLVFVIRDGDGGAEIDADVHEVTIADVRSGSLGAVA